MPAVDLLQARFLEYVDKTSSPKGCWLWIGGKNRDGYGHMKLVMPDGHIEQRAHRISFIWWKGPIPVGKIVLHKRFCNDRSCVNYEHLYAGTCRENSDDMLALGTPIRGENHYKAKLYPLQIRVIRSLRRRGMSLRAIARRFETAHCNIRSIVTRETWRHVNG